MTKLLIFIRENQRCDVELTIGAIVAMNGVRNAKRGNFIGAVFECEYGCAGTIETAPGWPLKDCLAQLNSDWKIELRNRALRGGYQLLG
jgi:hypothetical protein